MTKHRKCSEKCVDRCIVGSWVITVDNSIPGFPLITYGNVNINEDGTIVESDTAHIQQSNAVAPNGSRISNNLGLWKKIGHRHYKIFANNVFGSADICKLDYCESSGESVHTLPLDNSTIVRNKAVGDVWISEDCETATGSIVGSVYDKDDMTFSNPLASFPATIYFQRFHL